ncbi:SDR family oxidoreductase, partial [Pseudomonas aeruginosa]
VASTTGTRGRNPGEAAYIAAKASLVGWSMGMELEVAKRGITENSVAQGWSATASSTAEERQATLASPNGRAGRNEEVAGAGAFLAPLEASLVNGELLVVDGGNGMIENQRTCTCASA